MLQEAWDGKSCGMCLSLSLTAAVIQRHNTGSERNSTFHTAPRVFNTLSKSKSIIALASSTMLE